LARNDYGRHRTREGEAENNGGCSDTESQAASVHQAMMRLAVAVAQVGGSYTAWASVRECRSTLRFFGCPFMAATRREGEAATALPGKRAGV